MDMGSINIGSVEIWMLVQIVGTVAGLMFAYQMGRHIGRYWAYRRLAHLRNVGMRHRRNMAKNSVKAVKCHSCGEWTPTPQRLHAVNEN